MADVRSLIETIFQTVGFEQTISQLTKLEARTKTITQPFKPLVEFDVPVNKFDILRSKFEELAQRGEALRGKIPPAVIEQETSRVVPAFRRYAQLNSQFIEAQNNLVRSTQSLQIRLAKLGVGYEGLAAISESVIGRAKLSRAAFYQLVLGADASKTSIRNLAQAQEEHIGVSEKVLANLGITADTANRLSQAYAQYTNVFYNYGKAQALATNLTSAFATAQAVASQQASRLVAAVKPKAVFDVAESYLQLGQTLAKTGNQILQSSVFQSVLNMQHGFAVRAATNYQGALERFNSAARTYTQLLAESKEAGADQVTIQQKLAGAQERLRSAQQGLAVAVGHLAEAHKQAVNLAERELITRQRTEHYLSAEIGRRLSWVTTWGAAIMIEMAAMRLLRSAYEEVTWSQLNLAQASVTLNTSFGQLASAWSDIIAIATRTGTDISTTSRLFAETAQVFKDQALALEIVNQAQIAALSSGLNFYELERAVLPLFRALGVGIQDVSKWFSYLLYIQDQTGMNADFLAQNLAYLGRAITAFGASSEEAQRDVLIMAAALGEIYKEMPTPDLIQRASRFMTSLADPEVAVRLQELGLQTRSLGSFIESVAAIAGRSATKQRELFEEIIRVARINRLEAIWLRTLIEKAPDIFALYQRTLSQTGYSLEKFSASISTLLVKSRMLFATIVGALVNLSRIGLIEALTSMITILNAALQPLVIILGHVAALSERFQSIRFILAAIIAGFFTIKVLIPLIKVGIDSVVYAMELLSNIQAKLIYAQQRAGKVPIIPTPQPTPIVPTITPLLGPKGEVIKEVPVAEGAKGLLTQYVGEMQKASKEPQFVRALASTGYIFGFTAAFTLANSMMEGLADGKFTFEDLKKMGYNLTLNILAVGLGVLIAEALQLGFKTLIASGTFAAIKEGVVVLIGKIAESLSAAGASIAGAIGLADLPLSAITGIVLAVIATIGNIIALFDMLGSYLRGADVTQTLGYKFVKTELTSLLYVIGVPLRLLLSFFNSIGSLFGLDFTKQLKANLQRVYRAIPLARLQALFGDVIRSLLGIELAPDAQIRLKAKLDELGRKYGQLKKAYEEATQRFEETESIDALISATTNQARAIDVLTQRIKATKDEAQKRTLTEEKHKLILELNRNATQRLSNIYKNLSNSIKLGNITSEQAIALIDEATQATLTSAGAYLSEATRNEILIQAEEARLQAIKASNDSTLKAIEAKDAYAKYLEKEIELGHLSTSAYKTALSEEINLKRQAAVNLISQKNLLKTQAARDELTAEYYKLLEDAASLEDKLRRTDYEAQQKKVSQIRARVEAEEAVLDYLKEAVSKGRASISTYKETLSEAIRLKEQEVEALLTAISLAASEEDRAKAMTDYYKALSELDKLRERAIEDQISWTKEAVERAKNLYSLGKLSLLGYTQALLSSAQDLRSLRVSTFSEAFSSYFEALSSISRELSSLVDSIIEYGSRVSLGVGAIPEFRLPSSFMRSITSVEAYLNSLRQAQALASRIPVLEVRREAFRNIAKAYLSLLDSYREFALIGLEGAQRAKVELDLAVRELNLLRALFKQGLVSYSEVLRAEIDVARLRAEYQREALDEQERILELEVELGKRDKWALIQFYERRKAQARSYLEQLEYERKIRDLMEQMKEETEKAGQEIKGIFYGFEGLRIPTIPEVRGLAGGLWMTPISRPYEFNQVNNIQIFVSREVDVRKVTDVIERNLKIGGLTSSFVGVI